MLNHTLLGKARDIAEKLQANNLKKINIWREQEKYFLNISYPSLQAMGTVSQQDIQEIIQVPFKSESLALYVHLPFCQALCSYCHYYKIFKASSDVVRNYIDSIIVEISLRKWQFQNSKVSSIYIGGGTPSYCSTSEIERLFVAIQSNFAINEGAEVSFEVHPEHATPELFNLLNRVGVNRISIGVESLSDNVLSNQNRRHTAAQAIAAYDLALLNGFENINLDLIYGLPAQSLADWTDSLEKIVQLRPASVCAYYMRMKRGTPDFKKFFRSMASEEDRLIMHIMTFEAMSEVGYMQNTVDWFVREDIYNHKYQQSNWQKSESSGLLGVGASSYSYINGWQYYNINDIHKYESFIANKNPPIWKGEKLTSLEERMRRTIFLGIKTPISRSWFKDVYGCDLIEAFSEIWRVLANADLILIKDDLVSLTYTGKLFADEIGQLFYSESMAERMMQVENALVSTTHPKQNP